MMKPSYERIKFLQNQLRTAIQNHHVLLLKSRIAPQDTELKNQMNILQSLIISMGRTQNDLLDQLERELDHNKVAKVDVRHHLYWKVPQNVPIFKSVSKEYCMKLEETILPPGASVTSKKPPRCYSRMHSLLKPKDNNVPDGFIKGDEVPTVWKNSKKPQSVLKTKTVIESKGFIKLQSDTTKICGDITLSEGDIEDSSTSPKQRKTTDGEPKSRSTSVSPKPVEKVSKAPTSDKEHARKKIVESKLWTRSKRRRAVEAAAAAARAASFKCISGMDINELEESLKNEPFSNSVSPDENNSKSTDEGGKVKFFENLGLISISEREALRAKKGGRKRRTVAGQSNFYNDYLQHSALTIKNPKWRHEMQPVRRAPRKVASVEGPKRGISPPDPPTSGEVTPEEKNSPTRERESNRKTKLLPTRDNSCSISPEIESTHSNKENIEFKDPEVVHGNSSQNSVVVEATDLEEDEDKEKEKLCIFCRTTGDDSRLEICTVCGEKYHLACDEPNAENDGSCSMCFAQMSGLQSIVGGEAGVSYSSNLEVIKRYLPS